MLNQAIYSPNQENVCYFSIEKGELFYSLYKNEKAIIKKSRLGIKTYGKANFSHDFELVKIEEDSVVRTIETLWGENQFIRNHYNESVFYLKNNSCQLKLCFRVFDDSLAFRYELSSDYFKQLTISEELTEFNIDDDATCWSIPAYRPDRYEYNYEKHRLGELNYSVHTPLTIKSQDSFLSIHEAALYDYGAMNLKLNSRGVLVSDITPLSDHTKAHIKTPFKTPWRLIMFADTAVDLTKNQTMYALNEPPKQDFSWVKTLKFIGIWWAMYVGEWTWAPGDKHGATTDHAIEYIGAAVRLGISGLLIEGWNDGWEGDWLESGADSDFTKSTPDFDLEKVARYANRNDVNLIGHHETVGFIDNYEKQLEAAYSLYARNGIRYIKTGYAGSMMTYKGRKEYHHSQIGVNHYQKTVELAAKKHICLDIHEPIKGTGIEMTWPNLLAREGARGQEYEGGSLYPSHACILPYTRLLSGGMDYTNGILDMRNPVKPIMTTISRQLAYFVVIYSGMTMAADRPFIYEERYPDLFQFIKDVPANFAQTVPLAGEIGEYYVVARKDRNSEDWFIGGVNNEKPRHINLDLSFLGNHQSYDFKIFQDSADADYKNNPCGYLVEHKKIKVDQPLSIYMAPGGGFAIEIKIN